MLELKRPSQGHLMVNLARIFLFGIWFFNPGFAIELKEALAIKPFGIDIALSNIYLSQAKNQNLMPENSFNTGLMLLPNLSLRPFKNDITLKTSLEAYFEFEWLGKKRSSLLNSFEISDLKIRSQFKNAYLNKNLGLSFTPGLKTEIPISNSSRIANRILGIGTNLNLTWTKLGIIASIKPTIIFYIHSHPYKSSTCTDINSEGDRLTNGLCILKDPQTLVSSKNGVFLGYTLGNHTLMSGINISFGFLRRDSENNDKTIKLGTLGLLEYSYKLPVLLPMAVTLGINSNNQNYLFKESFKIPFFSTINGANHLSSIYANLDISF